MHIAITGGTGTLGSAAAAELRRRGHDVRLLSRKPPANALPAGTTHHPLDLVAATDKDIDAALDGVDVLVDAANATGRKLMRPLLVDGSRRLNAAASRVGVGHHVLASIVGIDQLSFSYYKVKVEQEQAVLGGPTPATCVRMTQFHTLIDWMLDSASSKMRVMPTGKLLFQPIDVADAARAMSDAAESGPTGAIVNVSGPEVLSLSQLARTWKAARGKGVLLPFRIPAVAGDAKRLAGGALTHREGTIEGGTTWAQFLAGSAEGRVPSAAASPNGAPAAGG